MPAVGVTGALIYRLRCADLGTELSVDRQKYDSGSAGASLPSQPNATLCTSALNWLEVRWVKQQPQAKGNLSRCKVMFSTNIHL